MEPLLVRLNEQLIIPLFYTLPETTQSEIKKACEIYVPPTRDQLGSHYQLWNEDNLLAMHLPRGFLSALREGIGSNNVIINDERAYRPDRYWYYGKTIKLHKYQEPAVDKIMEDKEGILVAPPGAGKTVMVLEAIRRSGEKSLIIVDKTNLLDQWRNRCIEFLGTSPDLVGGGHVSTGEAAITIAMQQTLSQNDNEYLTNKFVDSFGFVCLDECHHVSAETYTNVFESFPALYKIGVSATPTRNDGLEKISRLIIGPIIYTISNADTVAPTIIRKPTYFNHTFWGTHYVDALQICDVPNCKKNGKRHSHRNNYLQVVKALSEDYDRNFLIASHVVKNKECCNLIVSDRLSQLDALKELLNQAGFAEDRIYMLTGRESNKEREDVIYRAGYGECAILSTIAKEALDIPRLDRLYLAWPIKKDHILEQQIGRIVRPHPDKLEAIVYDFHDDCPVLSSQGHNRLRYYNSKGYSVE